MTAAPIDALLATVGTHVIMLSDVRMAQALGLVEGADLRAILARLVDRSLMLAEVERFQPPQPASTRVAAAFETLRARIGAEAFAAALRTNGFDEPYIHSFVMDTLRLEAYLSQRFGALADPSEEEVDAAMAARPTGESDDVLRARVRDQLRAARFSALVSQWVAELRTRNDVSIRPRSNDLLTITHE
ncbi:MAG: hypothetical protein AB7I50_12925 [Vicinamibacterales bacterium]